MKEEIRSGRSHGVLFRHSEAGDDAEAVARAIHEYATLEIESLGLPPLASPVGQDGD